MASKNQTLTISTDFANAKVDSSKFRDEIHDDSEGTIVTIVENVWTQGDTCHVDFTQDISAAEVTRLGELAALHDGEPEVEADTVSLQADPTIGLPLVQSLDIPPDAADLTTSYQIVAQPEVTANTDILIHGELVGPEGLCYIAGGAYQCRNSAVIGSALHLSLVDRDDALGMFGMLGMTRTRLDLQNVSGTIEVGHWAVGSTSGARSQVLSVVDADTIEVTFESGWQGGFQVMWEDGENVTFEAADGTPTGATAEFVDWVEGGVIEVQKMVKDEWIEGFDERVIRPGGSKQVPQGFYLRIQCSNESPQDKLRVKVNFFLATK